MIWLGFLLLFPIRRLVVVTATEDLADRCVFEDAFNRCCDQRGNGDNFDFVDQTCQRQRVRYDHFFDARVLDSLDGATAEDTMRSRSNNSNFRS
jgi:hypothetical protein